MSLKNDLIRLELIGIRNGRFRVRCYAALQDFDPSMLFWHGCWHQYAFVSSVWYAHAASH